MLCTGGTETRNKLVLESDNAAFDGFGIELLCPQLTGYSQVGNFSGQPVYSISQSTTRIRLQRICEDKSIERPKSPLYHPRPGCHAQYRVNIIGNKAKEHDRYAYFMDPPSTSSGVAGAEATGCFQAMYVQHPNRNGPVQQQLLDVRWPCGAHSMLVLDPRASEHPPRLLQSAIHGEVRQAVRLHRLPGGSGDGAPPGPYYASACAAGLTTSSAECQYVAVKVVVNSSLDPPLSMPERPREEVRSMTHIWRTHAPTEPSNVAQLLGCFAEASPTGNSYIVMPYYSGGELLHCAPEVCSNYDKVRACFRQMANGLRFVHAARVNHRDMSLENVMVHCPCADISRPPPTGAVVDATAELLIIDFGRGVIIPPDGESGDPEAWEFMRGSLRGTGLLYGARICGKVMYTPAEHSIETNKRALNPNRGLRGFPSDVWALGVMLFLLLTSSTPFIVPEQKNFTTRAEFFKLTNENFVGFLREIGAGGLRDRRCAHAWPGVDQSLLHSARGLRLGQHPCYELLMGMLCWPEEERLTVEQVLEHPWVREQPPPAPQYPPPRLEGMRVDV